MMFIIVWCIFSFTWFVRIYMKLLICGDVVDLDVVMLNVNCWWWIYTCLMLIFDTVITCIELCCWILMCNLIVVVFPCMKGVLVLIMVMLVDNHDNSCWIIMVMLLVIIYVYVHICCWWIFIHAMVLNCWCKHVLLVLIVEVVWTYALLLLSHMSMHHNMSL